MLPLTHFLSLSLFDLGARFIERGEDVKEQEEGLGVAQREHKDCAGTWVRVSISKT